MGLFGKKISKFIEILSPEDLWLPGVKIGDDSNYKILATNISSGGTVTSVGLSMPPAFNVTGSPITTNGTFEVSGAGTIDQYIRGDGTLADLPTAINSNVNLTATRVGFGSSLNLLTGSANLTWDDTNKILSLKKDSIGTANQSSGNLLLYNTTPATSTSNQQNSPMLQFLGHRWGSSDVATYWDIEIKPTAASSNLVISHETGSGTNKFAILTISGGNTSNGDVTVNANLFTGQLITTTILNLTGTGVSVNSSKFFGTGNLQLSDAARVTTDNNYRIHSKGSAQIDGSVYIPQLSVPTCSVAASTGSTTYKYKAVAKLITGETTEASTEVTTTTGAANLTTTPHLVSASYVEGAYQYLIYRTFSGGTPSSTGLIATLQYTNNGTNPAVIDSGLAGDGTTPPTSNATGVLKSVFIKLNSITTTLRDSISSPVAGTLIFNSTTLKFEGYDGSSWLTL